MAKPFTSITCRPRTPTETASFSSVASDVVSTGDLFNPLTSYPVIDVEKGGSIDGFVDGLNQIIDLLVPRENEEGGTYLVPGHGPICDRNDIVNYRDMVTVLRARIADMVEAGNDAGAGKSRQADHGL